MMAYSDHLSSAPPTLPHFPNRRIHIDRNRRHYYILPAIEEIRSHKQTHGRSLLASIILSISVVGRVHIIIRLFIDSCYLPCILSVITRYEGSNRALSSERPIWICGMWDMTGGLSLCPDQMHTNMYVVRVHVT